MKKPKNIYDLLNDMDFDINDYEKEELNDMEKKKLKDDFKKSNKKKFNFKKFGSIAAALLLSIGVLSQTNLGKEVYAATQSKLSEITYSIGYTLGIEKDISEYSNVIDQTVENNGVEVKLTDVIIDKDELILSTLINTNNPADMVDFDYDIFIDGKKIRHYSATGVTGKIDNSEEIFFVNDSVDIKDINLKDDLDIKIVLKNLNYYAYEKDIEYKEGENVEYEYFNKVKGKWIFEFNASGNELTANTYSLPIKYSFNIDNQRYNLEEFRYNPINQKIYGSIDYNDSKKVYDIKLEGYDDLGNEVEFYMSSSDKNSFILKYSNPYKDLSDKAKSITLAPYAVEFPEESGRMSNDFKLVGEEFTINLK